MSFNITINELVNLLIENDIEFQHKRVPNKYDRTEPERSFLIVGDYWVKFSANRTGQKLRKVTIDEGTVHEVPFDEFLDVHSLWNEYNNDLRITNENTILINMEDGTVANILNPEFHELEDGLYNFGALRFFPGEGDTKNVLVGGLIKK